MKRFETLLLFDYSETWMDKGTWRAHNSSFVCLANNSSHSTVQLNDCRVLDLPKRVAWPERDYSHIKPIRHLSFRIGIDLNSLLHQPGLVKSACRAHMRSEWPMAIVGLWSFSCMTLSIGFDLTQCACAHDMSNRLIHDIILAPAWIQTVIYKRICDSLPNVTFVVLVVHTKC